MASKDKKSKAEYIKAELSRTAKRRRDIAQEHKGLYDLRRMIPEPLADSKSYYKGLRSYPNYDLITGKPTDPNMTPPSNEKAEFLVGPLRPGESRLYMRAKRDAIKQAQEKKKKK